MTGRHGTLAGERRHRKYGETPCPACAAARAAYQAAYRAANLGAAVRAQQKEQARRQALSQLATAHPDEFAQYQAAALRHIRATPLPNNTTTPGA